MCNANDINSKCAVGCQRPSLDDPEYTELAADETPDEDEEFEQVEKIETVFQYVLEAGSLDGENLTAVADALADEFKILYDELNPFEDGITTVEVTIEMKEIEVEHCEATDFNGDVVEIDCREMDQSELDEEGNRRKRRFVGKLVEKGWTGAKKVAKKVVTPIVKTVLRYTPPFIKKGIQKVLAVSKKIVNKLQDEIEKVAKGLVDTVKKTTIGLLYKIEQLGEKATNYLLQKLECGTGGFGKVAGPALRMLKDKKMLAYETTKDRFSMIGMSLTPSSMENIGSSKFKLHTWMKSLPSKVRDLPLSMIAIPGTHNSATYALRTDMRFSPDFELNNGPMIPWYNSRAAAPIRKVSPLGHLVSAWGKCLKQNTYQQLMLGIRYFDFR